MEPSKLQDPETWEGTLLMCLALLAIVAKPVVVRINALCAIATLLSFDTYARGGDAPQLLSTELRAPVAKQRGAARMWTVTYHPLGGKCSKVGKHDHTATIASTHPDRLWLNELMWILSLRKRPQPTLFEMTPTLWLEKFHLARQLAGLDSSYPHRLRHGRASADALLTGAERIDDLTLADRKDLACTTSIVRYLRPEKYERELQKLGSIKIQKARDAVPLIITLCEKALQ